MPAPDFACSVEAPSSSPVGSFHLPIPISPGFGDAFAALKIDGARFVSLFPAPATSFVDRSTSQAGHQYSNSTSGVVLMRLQVPIVMDLTG
jgi:hypothetical protein